MRLAALWEPPSAQSCVASDTLKATAAALGMFAERSETDASATPAPAGTPAAAPVKTDSFHRRTFMARAQRLSDKGTDPQTLLDLVKEVRERIEIVHLCGDQVPGRII